MGKYFIGGKYKGKQADWVLARDRNYYTWAILNAPNLIFILRAYYLVSFFYAVNFR